MGSKFMAEDPNAFSCCAQGKAGNPLMMLLLVQLMLVILTLVRNADFISR
jgi:hypothetical protein